MDPALRALNRFALGARIGDRGRIREPREWLLAQLEGAPPLLPAPQGAGPAQVAAAIRSSGPADRRPARQRRVAVAAAESRAALQQRLTSERGYVERLVAFWSNHLCIAMRAKQLVVPLAGWYERQAIRPHVLGRFEDMVLASARHPAMLVYLDNVRSIGPGSAAARGGRRGLNENYARELLELHTLGATGGYTQQDVIQVARLLTGWTVRGFAVAGNTRAADSGDVGFAFDRAMHEPGTKTILGREYEAGVAAGERAIRELCRHPSTARFVAGKLVRHFVADAPPAAAVDRVAKVFRDTGGDLRAVSAELVRLPEAWEPESRKFRTPHDWLIAALRAFNTTTDGDVVVDLLRRLRYPLWSPQSPKGYGDTLQEWADPDSLMNRAELARTIGRRLRAAMPEPGALREVVDVPADDPLLRLLADSSITADERVALALASPAFQWR